MLKLPSHCNSEAVMMKILLGWKRGLSARSAAGGFRVYGTASAAIYQGSGCSVMRVIVQGCSLTSSVL